MNRSAAPLLSPALDHPHRLSVSGGAPGGPRVVSGPSVWLWVSARWVVALLASRSPGVSRGLVTALAAVTGR